MGEVTKDHSSHIIICDVKQVLLRDVNNVKGLKMANAYKISKAYVPHLKEGYENDIHYQGHYVACYIRHCSRVCYYESPR